MAMFPLLILQKFVCTFRADKQFGDVSSALDCLEGFVVGLYAEVFNAVVCLVNRCGSVTIVTLLPFMFPSFLQMYDVKRSIELQHSIG